MGINIGFISTRFAGTDGVSLESCKWADFFVKNGHACFWFAGQLEREPSRSLLVPEAHFKYEKNEWINSRVFGRTARSPDLTQMIHTLRSHLKRRLYDFIRRFDIHLLIAENVLSIPMQIPLGLALTETIAETQLPTIAHHHDFYWERARFSINAASDYLAMAFPPALPNIQHIVINSRAQKELARRTNIISAIIPNILDFENPPKINSQSAQAFRDSIGLKADDRMILQPTRVIRRKGIEHAIALLNKLDDSRNKLIVSHEDGDEGFEYSYWLKGFAREKKVDLKFVTTGIADPWNGNGNNGTKFNLWDVYPNADFVTYPSLNEGFGNAFLEAVYFKKPLLINRYDTFVSDIEPLGFDLVVMDGYLSERIIPQVQEILESRLRRNQMVNSNYHTAARNYSYTVLSDRLNMLLQPMLSKAPKRSAPMTTTPFNTGGRDVMPDPAYRSTSENGDEQSLSLMVN